MNKTRTNFTAKGSIVAIALTCLLFVTLMLGCATRPKPAADYVITGFDSTNVDVVKVLPVLDFRIDQSKQLDLDEWILPFTGRQLEELGYSYSIERDRSLLLNISRDDLEIPTRDFIKSLPSENARWVLVLALDELLTEGAFSGSSNAEMSGYLFDKENGQLMWRNKELQQLGMGGLMGLVLKSAMEHDAIMGATNKVLYALPDRKK